MAQELRAFVALTEGPMQFPIFTWWLYNSSSELVDTKHTYSTHIHACMQNIHKSFFNKIYFNCPPYFIFLWSESLSIRSSEQAFN